MGAPIVIFTLWIESGKLFNTGNSKFSSASTSAVWLSVKSSLGKLANKWPAVRACPTFLAHPMISIVLSFSKKHNIRKH